MFADPTHQVDGAQPTISSVVIISDPGTDDTYAIGDDIDVTVTFSEDIVVAGVPRLGLDIGGTNQYADYSGASGSAAKFVYTVEANDSDTDGVSINANRLARNAGRILDMASNSAILTHSAVSADSGHQVDGAVPLTASVQDRPSTHHGQSAFTFELRLSEEPKRPFSFRTMRDRAFDVTGGDVTRAKRITRGSNAR